MRQRSNIPVLAVLRSRDFRLLWSARSIHETARRMELLVLGYLILSLTGNSAFQVGLIAVFLNAPRPLLSLFAGLIADRLDRRRILIGVHTIYLGTATSILILVFTGVAEPWMIFAGVLVQGTAKVVDDPSRRTAIFDLAGPGHLSSAMSLETITNNFGKIAGPLTGGLLIAGTGFVGAFALLVALDLASLLFILPLRLPRRVPSDTAPPAVWASLGAGIKHSVNNRMSLGVLSVSLVMNALVLPIQYFIPVIASDVLRVGPALGGLLGSAEGLGTLFGAGFISVRREIRYHGRIFVAGALTIALGVSLVAWSPWFIVSYALLLMGGIGQAGFGTMQATILLLSSPPEMRGRIMGSQGLVNGLGHLIGGSEIGAIASAFGITIAMGLNAGAGLLLILLATALTPLVRQQVQPHSDQANPASSATPNPQQLPAEESGD